MKISKFAYCYPNEATGLMWCKHFSGKWAPPFPLSEVENDKAPIKGAESEEEEKV